MRTINQNSISLAKTNRWEVPAFIGREFFPKRHRFCVCVFVINEGEKIRAQLREMEAYAPQLDIIVADGGSSDGSLEEQFLKNCSVRVLLTKKGAGRLSAQMRMALAYALQQEYEGVIVVDGNHKDDITALPRFIAKLEEGYDHVQGSRFIPGGQAINTPLSRLVGLKLIHAPLMSLAARRRYTDTTNGFRAYSRALLTDPRVQPFRAVFSQYELHYYLAIRSARLGFKCTEVPVTRTYPKGGKVPTKISPLRGNLLILKTLFQAVTGQFDPPK